jgi:hypothetical protein
MVYKVCIKCDKIIEQKEQVDYDVFASFFHHGRDGSIDGETKRLINIYFHKKCFQDFKKKTKDKDVWFTQDTMSNRIIVKSR